MTKITIELTEDQLHLISEMQINYASYWQDRAEKEQDETEQERFKAKAAFSYRFWTSIVKQLAKAKTS